MHATLMHTFAVNSAASMQQQAQIQQLQAQVLALQAKCKL